MSAARSAIAFLQGLSIPEGPNAGRPVKLAPFQKQFVRGALGSNINVGALSIGRGNGKSALASGLALGAVLGVWDDQPRREILVAARTAEQGRIAWQFACGFARSLPDEQQRQLVFRRSPRLEIEFAGEHMLKVIAADGRTALGSSPTLVLMDERGHWRRDQGDELEAALLSGCGKRGGRALIISTSAADDGHPFSRWLDDDQPGVYRQEHRPAPGLPADDSESLLIANPGARHGIGASVEWLQAQGRRAIARGGSALTSFRLYNRNERVSGEARDVLLTVDQWTACETADLPPRVGQVVIGIDLGGSASMSAAAWYWPASGRLECRGWFPSRPGLSDRGAADGVGRRYQEMSDRGELAVLGDRVVPAAGFLASMMKHVEGGAVSALTCDRYRQSELVEALDAAGVRVPVAWRGQGFRDGSEDCERFRTACFDGRVRCAPSLLMRSALADAVCLKDPAGNVKLAKGRSTGRIDPAAAAVLAVAEGARQAGRGARKTRGAVWA